MDTSQAPPATARRTRRRPQAKVALALLEALRDLDRPGEVLDDENVTVTLPRRLGLSEVVDAQIRRYERETRASRRVPEPEVVDLIRLATRRPDSKTLFHQVGRALTSANGAPAWRAVLPQSFTLRLALRRIRRRLRALFGHRVVTIGHGSSRLEAASELLIEADGSGGACSMVTGLAQAIMDAYGSGVGEVAHSECRARGDAKCVWVVDSADRAGDRSNGSGPDD